MTLAVAGTTNHNVVCAVSFEALYDRYAAGILSYCMRRTTSELAEDAFAETFAVAWRRRDAIPAEPLPWLYGVARKVIANQRRSARRQAAVALRLVDTAPAPSAADACNAPLPTKETCLPLTG
jgi:RNA polymerase sigma-70 factor, ECF subfamily